MRVLLVNGWFAPGGVFYPRGEHELADALRSQLPRRTKMLDEGALPLMELEDVRAEAEAARKRILAHQQQVREEAQKANSAPERRKMADTPHRVRKEYTTATLSNAAEAPEAPQET